MMIPLPYDWFDCPHTGFIEFGYQITPSLSLRLITAGTEENISSPEREYACLLEETSVQDCQRPFAFRRFFERLQELHLGELVNAESDWQFRSKERHLTVVYQLAKEFFSSESSGQL
jgi:hypothetical protein